MSSSSTPIPTPAFTQAIRSLPLPNLHLKAAELRNSIAHLQYSNIELKRWAENGDEDCAEAIRENEVTIRRMEERIGFLRREVEIRGFVWGESEGEGKGGDEGVGNGIGDGEEVVVRRENRREGERNVEEGNLGRRGGSLSDEELARRLREQMEEADDEDGSGIHL
ncbi:MAG: hypothetical protein M1812_007816 [Candelaria pacifica]|nr:MAG: hypothetical protein M1812_007816 [Candelaria pacifica]